MKPRRSSSPYPGSGSCREPGRRRGCMPCVSLAPGTVGCLFTRNSCACPVLARSN
jgi:hypothetical protein